MDDRIELLFRMYEEAMEHVRHLEEQRSQFASVLVAISGGVVAFGLAEGKRHPEFYPDILLIGIGVFGLLLSWKQNEKINYHRRVALRYRMLVEANSLLSHNSLESMRNEEDRINNRRYCYISILPVGLFWSLLYILIIGFGTFLSTK
jgi:hypothetical protein